MNQTRFVVSLRWLLVVAVVGAMIALSGYASANEFLRREGRYVRLTTDLASAEEADALVASFDAAVPLWTQFWNLPSDALKTWKVDACVIRNKAEFQRQGLLPPEVPDFPFGYALGNRIWVLAQQSEYYTRHLMLHEGVHSFAFFQFGGAGPTWFREGTAELLATHSGIGDRLKINQIPANRDDVPYWGRFTLMKQLRSKSVIPTFDTVMGYKPDLLGDVESYGWSWAAAMLLHTYPEYQEAFYAAARNGRNQGPKFNRRLRESLQSQWPILAARWRLMCHDLDYGFDWSHERVNLSMRDPEWDRQPISLDVSASGGWQSIGVRIPGRTKIKISPAGQITLAGAPKPWTSESSGITFKYHRGRPLGQLLVCVLPNAFDAQAKFLAPLQVQSIEREKTIPIAQYSWLLMRVNDDVGELDDNTGSYRVTIARGG